MQPSDSFSVSRRALDVEDYIDIVRRHKGWIFGPFLFCLVASVVGVYLWPDSYVSEARVKIDQQQIPESMVQSTAGQSQIWDRIQSMSQQIVSRATLTTIIQTKNLYPRERASKPLEDVIEDMRTHIHVDPIASQGGGHLIPAFTIRFQYENKYLAQSVVAELMSKFIDQNSRDMQGRTFTGVQFMKDQTDRAKKELDDIENQLTDFQVKNNGRLPDQAEANMRSLMSLEQSLTMLNSGISQRQNDKLQIEANIRIQEDSGRQIDKAIADMPPPATVAGQQQRNDRLTDAERDVQHLDDTLHQYLQKYTENHPDVQSIKAQLALAIQKRDDLEKEDRQKKEDAKKEEAAKAAKGDTPARTNPAVARDQIERQANINRLKALIASKDQEIDDLQKQVKRTEAEIGSYRGKLESLPIGMKQYTDLLRDREAAKAKYLDLDDKLAKAQRASDMENNNQGERLEPLDTASLPTDPTEPKRPMVISIGAGIGLLLGIAIAGAREMKDTSLKNLKDVRAYTQMAVLGSIPLLENDFVVRRRKRLAWLGWTTACLVAVVLMVGAIVYWANSTKGGLQ